MSLKDSIVEPLKLIIMKTKRKLSAYCHRVLFIMREIRIVSGESADSIALDLGYKYTSSYCKLERAEVHELTVDTTKGFCDHFNISMIFLFMLTDLSFGDSQNIGLELSCDKKAMLTPNELRILNHLVKKNL